MIRVPVSLEQMRALLRKVAPQLTIQQRLKLLRELAQADAQPAAPAPARPAAERHAERQVPAERQIPTERPAPAERPAPELPREAERRETPAAEVPASHLGAVPPAPPPIIAGRIDVSPNWPAVRQPPPVPPPNALSPPTPTPAPTPAERAGAGDADLAAAAPVAPAPAVEVEEAVPTDHGVEGDRPRATWERRLYRLFKPARVQAKHLESTMLSDLIRRSVTEVRAK